jgi:DNA recombination protein RmuC
MTHFLLGSLSGLICGIVLGGALTWWLTKINGEQARAQLQSTLDKLSLQQLQLTQQALDQTSQKHSAAQVQNLSLVLDPLKERLRDFEKKVEDTYSAERAERGYLRGELSRLMDLNAKMSHETQNLTKALKGDVKVQGNWGEMLLNSILEKSGLRREEEYFVQSETLGTLRNDSGEIIRPDVIVKLPENKHLIIDSKVSLVAYEAYVNSTTAEDQARWANKHLVSVRSHIEGLAQKKYFSSDELQSPDFVILFMPLEPAFALAFREDPQLLSWAWEKHVAIVSPTTLMTTLRTVAQLWRQERQQKNALEIAKRGGALYDKFTSFLQDFDALGSRLEAAQKAFLGVRNKLSSSPGNLIRQVEMLRELGIRTEKKIDPALLDKSKEEGEVS